jgi:ethanolamine utilization protein EutA
VQLPVKNVPVLHPESLDSLGSELAKQEGLSVIALEGIASPRYRQVQEMAQKIASAVTAGPVLLCLQQDMAKALGQALALRMGKEAQILCIDRVKLPEGSFLDVGIPVGPAFPVVVKTLILSG